MADFLKNLAFALSVGAGAGIVIQVFSLVIPMYYANIYTGIALLAAVATAAAVSRGRRITMERTALVMDGFGFQERIVTAYGHLKEEDMMSLLQRRDAMEQLKIHRDWIRIPLWPDAKRVALPLALLVVMTGLVFVPSQVREKAREIHQIQQEAQEQVQEIEEILEELEKLEELETLTPEQQAALQEMAESLQSSMAEYSQVSAADALKAAGEKLDYKYADMSSQLSAIAQSIQNGATVTPMAAESMQAMADKLQKMSGNTLQDKDSIAAGQNGQGSGEGEGQNGQGNGQGGQGNQNGSGRGTGTADNPHDYVSIPNAIADSGNLTGNAVDHDESEYFRAQNGLSWEGAHMSYEQVIGSYEENAYEGIASGRYPSGMEDVIREYFSSFN